MFKRQSRRIVVASSVLIITSLPVALAQSSAVQVPVAGSAVPVSQPVTVTVNGPTTSVTATKTIDAMAQDRQKPAPRSRFPERDLSPKESGALSAERALAAKLINAERVNIRIQGHPNISGEYRVGGDGTIAVPVLGRFEIVDTTIGEFEKRLSESVTTLSSRESSVTVEVVEYRSIFVSGNVARAGAFPWKPGLSVLHAETLAGGVSRAAGMGGGTGIGFGGPDVEKDRAKRAAYELASMLATIARLRTEKENGDKIAFLPLLSNLVTQAHQARIVAAQEATLKSRNTAFESRVSALQSAKNLALKERDALEAQRVRMNDQLGKRRATLMKIERMAEQGYIRADRVFEDQVRIAELEERITNTTIAISRISATAAIAQGDLDVLIRNRVAEIDTEILRLESLASQLQLEFESANGAFKRITGQDISAESGATYVSYEIVRLEGGVSRHLKANQSTLLRPGDVVVVGVDNKSPM